MFHPHSIKCLQAVVVALLSLGSVHAAPTDLTSLEVRNHQLPAIWPPPQQISPSGSEVSLRGKVTIVTGNATDSSTIDAVKAVVAAAGGRATTSSRPTRQGTQIFIGTDEENSDAAAIAKALTGSSASDLDAEGYVLASGNYNHRPSIVLNGVDTRGTFYAAQTLRQLVDGSKVPGVKVRDWPLMSIRGSIEGFYGVPWSHQGRLDQFVFYGKHKMNTYVYTPKDDSLLRSDWRTLYSDDDIAQLKELIDTANANHVDFTYALSPGLDLCYSSDDDFNATVAKFDQIRDLGVNSFSIPLDDIPLEFHCDSDKQRWNDTGDWHWIADAQTYYLNRVQKDYIKVNNLNDLQTVPTNYAGSDPDPYKEEFGTQLDDDIRIQWTGEGVFSADVTVASVEQADKTYVTDNLFIWDNFPVNDGNRDRLFLNPLTGRDADLYEHLIGFTSNPMEQPYASMPALANFGDYTWNGPAYDADKSMAAALLELAGTNKKVHEALVAFVDLNLNWPYRTPEVNSPDLNKDITEFWTARNSSSRKGEQPLRNRLALITTLPDVLPKMAMKGFASDVAPWSTVAMQWAKACQHLIAMLDALEKGDKDTAESEYNAAQDWIEKTKAKTVDDRNDDGEDLPDSITPAIGTDAFDTFAANATTIYSNLKG